MFITIAASVLTTLALQQTDTTVTVRPGGRLELDNFEGSITITVWNRNAVRVEASHGSRDEVEVEVSGPVVTVRGTGRHGSASVDYRITVPAAMDLSLSGQSGDITVEGTTGEVSVETVEGNITVQGGSGFISLHSVEGEIRLERASGRIDLNSVDGDITLADAAGEIRAETVDGEIELTRIDSPEVEARTVDGNISYEGKIREKGRYRFASHDGDVSIAVPELNAAVSVSTFSGEFESDFPVTLSSTKPGRRLSFTLGAGSARLELESFDGTIRIRKVGGKVRSEK